MQLLGRNVRRAFSGKNQSLGLCSRTCRTTTQASQGVDVQDLAKRAHVAITEEEAKEWAPKINSIVDWFGQLTAVDVSNVQPSIHAMDEGNRLRPDEAALSPVRSELLAQAADIEKTYIKVPKTTADDAGAKAKAPAPPAAAPGGVSAEALHALDLRVGRVVLCEQHPDADSLYVEKIDVGEVEPRTIVSGLVKYVPLDQMQGRMVVVICNLKPRNMRGIKSFGMLLAASDARHAVVEPLLPAPGAQPGERIFFGDSHDQAPPVEAKVMDKKKYWEAVQPLLSTDEQRVAACAGLTMRSAAGPISSQTLVGARIA